MIPSLMNAAQRRPLRRQHGMFIVEMTAVVIMFVTLVFMAIEMSRALYLWNALQEVTRRAAREAAVTDFSDPAALAAIRQRAVFRDSPGLLALGDPVTDQHVRIDYLSLQHETDSKLKLVPIPTGSLPACPTRNRIVCTAKAGDPSCIRMVRVRICRPGADGCERVKFEPLLPFVDGDVNLPVSETLVRAESLGYVPGAPSCAP